MTPHVSAPNGAPTPRRPPASHLDAYREGQARGRAEDVLLWTGQKAKWIADYTGLPLTVVLRILVPYYRRRGDLTREIAEALGVSIRTVDRHLAVARSIAARKQAA